jgi:hypothetical protein
VTWWPATYHLKTGNCPGVQDFILFSEYSALVTSNKPSSVRRVPYGELHILFILDRDFVGQQPNLFIQDNAVLNINSYLLSVQRHGVQKIILFRQDSFLLESNYVLLQEHCIGALQPILFIQDSDVVDSNTTSSVRKVTWLPAIHPLQSGHFSGGHLIFFSEKSVLVGRPRPLQSGSHFVASNSNSSLKIMT